MNFDTRVWYAKQGRVMLKPLATALFFVILFCGCGYFDSVVNPVASTPATLNGRVVDSILRKGLMNAKVVLSGQRDTVALTDEDGLFQFPIATTGKKTITVTLPGYEGWSKAIDLKKTDNDFETVLLVRHNLPPRILKMCYPLHGASNVPLLVTFQWMAYDVDFNLPTSQELLRYRFYFGGTNSPPFADSGSLMRNPMTGDTVLVSNLDTLLDSNTTYYWKIVLTDALGDSAVYPVDSFKTRHAFDTVCPVDMKIVEMESLSFCMDKYEFTNEEYLLFDQTMTVLDLNDLSNELNGPVINMAYDSARNACLSQGKRLCHVLEWQAASGGYRRLDYPYGDEYDSLKCNTNVPKPFETTARIVGSMDSCVSTYGIYDLSGNVAEWVTRLDNMTFIPRLDSLGNLLHYYAGGDWSSRVHSGTFELNSTTKDNRPNIGFRCCKSLK